MYGKSKLGLMSSWRQLSRPLRRQRHLFTGIYCSLSKSRFYISVFLDIIRWQRHWEGLSPGEKIFPPAPQEQIGSLPQPRHCSHFCKTNKKVNLMLNCCWWLSPARHFGSGVRDVEVRHVLSHQFFTQMHLEKLTGVQLSFQLFLTFLWGSASSIVVSGPSGFLLAMGTRRFEEEEVVVGWILKVLVDKGWM